jgi:ABC-2 type transport system ATP-binding protein
VRVFATLLRPDSGRAIVAGRDVVRHPDEVRSRIALAGQFAMVDEYLTGLENIELFCRLHHMRRPAARARARELVERFGLAEVAGRQARTYSGGTRRRLDLATSLVSRPSVLFLDEPTTGLDPMSRRDVWRLIAELADGGTTVVLTTQYLEEADVVADRVAVIDRGRAIAEGTVEELKRTVGSDRLEVALADRESVAAARGVLERHTDAVRVDEDAALVSAKLDDALAHLPDVMRDLDVRGASVAGVRIRQPTLEDAFLSLVGAGREVEAVP